MNILLNGNQFETEVKDILESYVVLYNLTKNYKMTFEIARHLNGVHVYFKTFIMNIQIFEAIIDLTRQRIRFIMHETYIGSMVEDEPGLNKYPFESMGDKNGLFEKKIFTLQKEELLDFFIELDKIIIG